MIMDRCYNDNTVGCLIIKKKNLNGVLRQELTDWQILM